MEVRRNTRTAPTVGRQQFAQAEQTDYRPLLQGAADLRAGLDEGRRRRQSFELQKRLLEEKNALGADLERRRRDPSYDPTTIATTADSDYTDRVNAVTEEFRQQGYDPDLVDQFFSGMGAVRNELSDRALTYQLGALRERAVSNANLLLDEGTRAVVNDRDSYEETANYIGDTILLNPDLTDEEKQKLFDDIRPALRAAAAEGWAMEDPAGLIEQLDPDGRWRQERDAPVSGAAASVVAGAIRAEGKPAEVASVLSAGGLSPQVVAGFLGNFEVEGGYEGAQGDRGTASGIAQWRLERRDAFRQKYGVDPHRATAAQQAEFVLWELTTPEGRRVASLSESRANEILNAPTAERAAELIDKYYERSDGTHRQRRVQAAASFLQSDLAPGGERVPQSGDVQAIDPGASAAPESEFSTTRDLPTEPAEPKALHPVLRDLTGQERLRLLSLADSNMRKSTANQKAALDVLIQNVKAEALSNGDVAAPIPSDEEILATYGEVAGPQVISDMRQTIQLGRSLKTFAVMPDTQMAAEVEKLRPQPGSPTFATDSELFQAAEKARAQILQQRQADPAAYVLANFPDVQAAADNPGQFYARMDRALESLGFDPQRVSPLPQAARDRIIEQWPTMGPKARRQWFNENFNRMGEDRIKAFARGAEGTKMEEELRIYAFGIGRMPPSTIEEIFGGRDIIAKDPARKPPPEKVTEVFRRSAFSAVLSMAPDASAALQDAAAAIYVARGGRVDPALDETAYKKAVASALGGAEPFNDSKGMVKDYTIPPPGVSASRFTSWVEQLQPGELSRLSVEGTAPKYGDLRTEVKLRDIVEDGVFVMWAPGLYRIRMASDGGYLKTASGNSFLVRLKPEDVR